jgi:hypothetical protein
MKEYFEVEAREKSQDLMMGEILSQPKQGRPEQRAEQKDGRKVGEESGGVFQAC